MIIYTKSGVKSKNVFARIYIRDTSIVLRLFLNQVDKHRKFIEDTPYHIKNVFVGDYGKCKHCRDDKEDGACRFRKTYTLDNQLIEKCNGLTFEFHDPSLQKLNDYIGLFTEFSRRKSAEECVIVNGMSAKAPATNLYTLVVGALALLTG